LSGNWRAVFRDLKKGIMSHFVSIQTQIKDLEALRLACAELGLRIEANAEARGIGTQQRADHVIRLNGPCDIAVQPQANGTFGLSTDWWGGHVEKEVGANYGRLLQLYAVHKTAREARKRGLTIQRRSLANGTIQVVLTGASL